MNNFKKSLVLATAALFSANFATQAADDSVPPQGMQRVVFVYHFDKPQDPVAKATQETQQLIQYQLVLDVQASAHGTINSIGDDLMMVAQADSKTVAESATFTE